MPYVNIKITREGGTTPEQKAALIQGVTDVLVDVLDKSPSSTFVVLDEVDMENWGIGGLPVEEYRRNRRTQKPPGELDGRATGDGHGKSAKGDARMEP